MVWCSRSLPDHQIKQPAPGQTIHHDIKSSWPGRRDETLPDKIWIQGQHQQPHSTFLVHRLLVCSISHKTSPSLHLQLHIYISRPAQLRSRPSIRKKVYVLPGSQPSRPHNPLLQSQSQLHSRKPPLIVVRELRPSSYHESSLRWKQSHSHNNRPSLFSMQ